MEMTKKTIPHAQLEVSRSAVLNNYRYYRSKLNPGTKILRLEDGELVTFRIALTKRFLADLNDLIGEYEKFTDAEVRDFFLKDAFTMRDDALAKIREYRRQMKRK